VEGARTARKPARIEYRGSQPKEKSSRKEEYKVLLNGASRGEPGVNETVKGSNLWQQTWDKKTVTNRKNRGKRGGKGLKDNFGEEKKFGALVGRRRGQRAKEKVSRFRLV